MASSRSDAAPAPPLRVVRVIARLNVGGPARHVVLLDRGLRARGHQTLLVHGTIGPGEASLEHLAADVAIPSLKLPELGRRVNPLDDVRAFMRLVRTIFREQPDVIHTHTAKAGVLGRLSGLLFNATRRRRRRAVLVHTFHGHVLEGYFSRPVNGLVRVTERWLARGTDRIVTISPAQRADIVDRFRIASSGRTVVVPLGLDLTALLEGTGCPLRADLGIDPASVVFGYVGRLVPIKDLPTLVRAFALALARAPNLDLLIAGDGPVRADLERLARDLGVEARVHVVGWREDLERLYATMDVAVLSSRNEGTPVAIIEAMASGRPVVATAVGGVGDVVDEATGLLVPPRDATAMADAMVRLARDPDARARMGARGRERARARFQYDRLVRDVEQVYVDALAGRRA